MLFRQRKQLGICHRSIAFCHNRSNLSVASDHSCRRAAGILPKRARLRKAKPACADYPSLTACFSCVLEANPRVHNQLSGFLDEACPDKPLKRLVTALGFDPPRSNEVLVTDRVVMPRTERENLDSKFMAFRMFILCDSSIQRDTIAKLNENSWSSDCPTT